MENSIKAPGLLCPVCDQEVGNDQDLLEHLCFTHFRTTRIKHYGSPIYLCWCGWEVGMMMTGRASLQEHFDKHGGLAAHMQACLLNILGAK